MIFNPPNTSGYVPYTGATVNVDLNTKTLSNGGMTITKDNNDFDASITSSAHLLLENPTGSQTETIYSFGGTGVGGTRFDAGGNYALQASGWQGFQIFNSIDTSDPYTKSIAINGFLFGGAGATGWTADYPFQVKDSGGNDVWHADMSGNQYIGGNINTFGTSNTFAGYNTFGDTYHHDNNWANEFVQMAGNGIDGWTAKFISDTTNGVIFGAINADNTNGFFIQSGPVYVGGVDQQDVVFVQGSTTPGWLHITDGYGNVSDNFKMKIGGMYNIGKYIDSTNSAGTSGYVLKSTGTATTWSKQYTATGTATLVSGTKAITISGLTSGNQAFVTVVTPGGTMGYHYKAVCTTNTLTITAVGLTGATVTTDTSTLNYLII